MNNDISTSSRNGNGIRVFLTLIIVYAFFTNHYLTTNGASRFSLTVALVEKGSPEISDILPKVISPGWKIKDYATVGRRVYSEKAPLPSFLAVPVYYVFTRMGFGFEWVVYFTTLFTSGLFTALTGFMIYKTVPLWVDDERRRVLLALTYGLGTMALVYGTVFFSHGITAFMGLASFYFLSLLQAGRDRQEYAVLGGLFAGASVLSDYFSAITVVCLLGYAVAGRRHLLSVFIGFSVPIALLLLYNDWVFGAPWPLSYSYSRLYGQLHSEGLYGITLPTAEHLSHLGKILFSRWGFLFTNMVFLFCIFSFPRMWLFRRQAVTILVMAAGYMYLNASESWLDAYSARFFMPLVPFLVVSLTFMDFGNRWLRNTFFLLLGFSVIINFVGADYHLRQFMLDPYRSGMQNLAAHMLDKYGLGPGFKNFLFVLPFIIPVWLMPAPRTSRKS